jgi:hypothetical protein
MSTFIGPEQQAPTAAISSGQFFWQAPNTVVYNGIRFGFHVKAASGNWQLKAFRRDNVTKLWTEADPGNGPLVGKPGVAFGHAVVALGGYTMGSGVLNVDSVVGNPPFQGTMPFTVVLGNPVGPPGILAQLSVTGINTPTQFAVTPIVDANVPAGTGVFQTTSTPSNVLETPNGCPTFIQDPADPTGKTVIIAYPENSLSLLSFVLFDCSANGGLGAFGAVTTGGPQVHGVDHVSAGKNYNDDTGAKTCVAYRKLDNKLLFNYQGVLENVAGTTWIRPYLVTYDRTGLSWGASQQLTGAGESKPFAAHGIVVDPKTNNAFATVVLPPDGISSNYEAYCVPINSANVIQPRVVMTTTVQNVREPLVGYPFLRPVGASFELIVPYVQGNTFNTIAAAVARAAVGLAPVFATQALSSGREQAPGDGSALASVGGNVGPDGNAHIFWFGDLSLTDFFYRLFYSTNAGAGWTPPVELYRTVSDDSIDFLEKGATVSALPGIGLAIVGLTAFITPSSPGVDGAVFFEFDIPTTPPVLTLTFKGQKVYAK